MAWFYFSSNEPLFELVCDLFWLAVRSLLFVLSFLIDWDTGNLKAGDPVGILPYLAYGLSRIELEGRGNSVSHTGSRLYF